MKVAFYSPSWPLARSQNGIVTYVDIMRRALTEAGHEAVVLTPYLIEQESGDAGRVFELPELRKAWLSGLFRRIQTKRLGAVSTLPRRLGQRVSIALEKASAGAPVDILDIEETFGMSCFVKGAPSVVRLHGPHFLGHFGRKTAADEKRIEAEGAAIKAAAGVTSPSPGLLEQTKKRYGEIAPLHAAIPNPANTAPPGLCWRYEDCDPNLVLFIGRFDLRKGADVMLEAFSKAASVNKKLRLAMAGGDAGVELGSGEVVRYADYAQRFLSEDVVSRIEYLGLATPEQLNNWRRKAVVTVSASRFECCAYAIAETLALGCPAVVSSTFGQPEFVKENEALLVAQIGDADQLAAQISAVCENSGLAKELGAAGKHAMEQIFSPEKVATQMASFYAKAISRAGKLR